MEHNFKIGDKLECIENYGSWIKKGDVITVKNFENKSKSQDKSYDGWIVPLENSRLHFPHNIFKKIYVSKNVGPIDILSSRVEDMDLLHNQAGFKIENCIGSLMQLLNHRTGLANMLKKAYNEDEIKYLKDYIKYTNDNICKILAIPTHNTPPSPLS